MQDARSLELKVGIFVLAAFAVLASIVFVIGSRRNVFGSKAEYRARFHSVGGLRAGAPVRIAGVDIGSVGDLELLPDGRIEARFDIDVAYARLVQTDSKASIGSKGLLGDKLIDVTVGTSGSPLPRGGEVTAEEPSDLNAIMAEAQTMMVDAKATIANLRTATGVLSDPQFQTDVKSATHNASEVLRTMADGRGTVHRLLTDEALAARVDQTVTNVQNTSRELARTSSGVRAITEEIRAGNGSAHRLIYGPEAADLARNLSRATGETAAVLTEVRTGNGTLHNLIYEDRSAEILANAEAITADVRAITADIRAGRGTLGGFLADPSIYEDIKRLVGDLQRNEILRALVRYSIRNDEARPTPAASPGGP